MVADVPTFQSPAPGRIREIDEALRGRLPPSGCIHRLLTPSEFHGADGRQHQPSGARFLPLTWAALFACRHSFPCRVQIRNLIPSMRYANQPLE